ncbi:hypothetical protein K8R78_07125 [bacterium]|nr:hypothetical protein [bacterium]
MRKNHLFYLLLLIVLIGGSMLIACDDDGATAETADENGDVSSADDCVGCEGGVCPAPIPEEDTKTGEEAPVEDVATE